MRAANEDGKGKKQRESRSQLPNTPNQEYRVEMIFLSVHITCSDLPAGKK